MNMRLFASAYLPANIEPICRLRKIRISRRLSGASAARLEVEQPKSIAARHGVGVTPPRRFRARPAVSEGPRKGSEFTVRLPAAAADETPRSTSPLELATPARKCARVLVVDDNVDTADGLSKLLTLLGHDVKTAYDGLQALEMAKALSPEVILLDFGLPSLDGYEVARQLREHECCRDTLMIAISGYGREEDRRKAKEFGFDHHLTKPVDYKALTAVLDERE